MKRRNKFSLSHYKLLSCKMGQLVPIGLTEVLPGDTIQQSTSVFIRFSPMVAPVMHPVHVKIHHWYVPFRLIWDDFEDFITGGPDGLNDSTPPYFRMRRGDNVFTTGSLFDYLGIPPGFTNLIPEDVDVRPSSLPVRAYNLIWNEWYRDQNLQDPLSISTTSGVETTNPLTSISLQYSAWNKDYFTTATPWEQKGIAVQVPVNGDPQGTITITGAPGFTGGGSGLEYGNVNTFYGNGPDITLGSMSDGSTTITATKGTLSAAFDGTGSLGNIDLNQLREAFALQRFEEHRALYGSRYVEYLRYLGIKASDARLQRPEYLGGGRSTIQFSEVLQTGADGDTPVGTMRGHGIGAIRTNRYRRFIEEHGLVMTLMTIRPISVYTQGLPRMFSRRTKEDYWQKELEHIGQQEIRNSEVYVGSSAPDGTFGFTDRYDEYRSHESSVAGEFRNTLNYWHFGREFADEPVLNGDFISSAPTNRPFADQTGNDTLYVMANHSIQARRIISRKGTPI